MCTHCWLGLYLQGLASLYEEWACTVDGQDADAHWRGAVEPLERLVATAKR